MACFHPHTARVRLDWVESCRQCRETRWAWQTGFWKPAHRVIVRVDGRLEYRDRAGTLYRNVAASTT
jgi:hypothetical protein